MIITVLSIGGILAAAGFVIANLFWRAPGEGLASGQSAAFRRGYSAPATSTTRAMLWPSVLLSLSLLAVPVVFFFGAHVVDPGGNALAGLSASASMWLHLAFGAAGLVGVASIAGGFNAVARSSVPRGLAASFAVLALTTVAFVAYSTSNEDVASVAGRRIADAYFRVGRDAAEKVIGAADDTAKPLDTHGVRVLGVVTHTIATIDVGYLSHSVMPTPVRQSTVQETVKLQAESFGLARYTFTAEIGRFDKDKKPPITTWLGSNPPTPAVDGGLDDPSSSNDLATMISSVTTSTRPVQSNPRKLYAEVTVTMSKLPLDKPVHLTLRYTLNQWDHVAESARVTWLAPWHYGGAATQTIPRFEWRIDLPASGGFTYHGIEDAGHDVDRVLVSAGASTELRALVLKELSATPKTESRAWKFLTPSALMDPSRGWQVTVEKAAHGYSRLRVSGELSHLLGLVYTASPSLSAEQGQAFYWHFLRETSQKETDQ